ncbi:MAG: L-threonine 3-dehydrogenase, partial [Thermoplasmata archaeon]|nr:L-threonine 3-dehydrogenase [Thermoplasmata archaeon]
MAGKMLAAVKTKPQPGAIEMREVPRPEVGPHEALVRVKIASICGTDVHIYDWDEWSRARIRPPLIQGHEFAGEVVELGSDATLVHKGDYVSAEGHIACNTCYQCRTGNAHVCRNVQIIGVDRDGAFAEYVAVPEANLVINPDELPLEMATIQDPFGNAVQTVFSADVPGNYVAIFGLGPIGLMTVALCRAVAAGKIFAIGHRNEYRLNLAERLGADHVLRSDASLAATIDRETEGRGVDHVLEMSGSAEAFNLGLQIVRPAGGVHVLGIYPEPFSVDVSEIVTKGVSLHGIHGRLMYKTWYRMAGLLTSGRLDLTPIITHRFAFKDFPEAMEVVKSG